MPPEEVHYVGEPVAVVVAESRYIAEDALELIDVDYEVLPAVASTAAALRPRRAARALQAPTSNVAVPLTQRAGDPDEALRTAPHTLSRGVLRHARRRALDGDPRRRGPLRARPPGS